MVVYSQNNPAWQHEKIGFDQGPYDTIGNYGCYMTAIANVCSWAGSDIDPQQINDICKDRGWLVSSDLVSRDDVPAQLCSNLQFEGRTNWHTATPMNFFADASDPNVAYIICIDASHAPGIQTHFVMVWATNGPNDLIIDDSWDGQRKSLTHYGTPSVIIQSATKFRKVAPVVAPPPPPVVVPEPVVVPVPKPYVPPAAPVPVKKAEKYKLVATLPYFASLDDARNDKNAVSTIDAGEYYVWDKGGISGSFYNLSTSNSVNEQKWVNTLDNKVQLDTTRLDPPEMDKPVDTPNPAPIPDNVDPATMNWHGTLDLRYAGVYVFWNHNKEHDEVANKVAIYDLETGQIKKQTDNGTYAQFSGKVKWTDGNWYGRMKDTDGSFHWYAAKIEDLYPYNEVYGTRTSLKEREALHTLTATDRIELWISRFTTIGHNIMDVLVKTKKGK